MTEYFYDNINYNFCIIEKIVDNKKGVLNVTAITKIKDKFDGVRYHADLDHFKSEKIYDGDQILIDSALGSCVTFSHYNLHEAFKNYDICFFKNGIQNYKIENLVNIYFNFYQDKAFCKFLINNLVDSNTKAQINSITDFLASTLKEN